MDEAASSIDTGTLIDVRWRMQQLTMTMTMRMRTWRVTSGSRSVDDNQIFHFNLLDLSAERASLSQSCLTTGRLAEDGGAGTAEDDSGGMREDGGDLEASRALDIHEE